MRPNRSGGGSTHSDSDNGRITCVNMSLRRYIAKAYGVREDQISAPDWLATERFDLVAKASGSVKSDTLMQMLQTLLAERFKLVLHRETKEERVYALIVAKGGSKLIAVTPTGSSSTNSTRGSLTAEQTSMTSLANRLSQLVGITVVDATGLTDVFNFKLEWDPAATAPSDAPDSGPSIFTALQQQLGLKLESRKMPVEFLVVDHAEKVPTEN